MTRNPGLILALACSLMPDGAPGSYNVTLANHLQKRLEAYQAAHNKWPYVGVQ